MVTAHLTQIDLPEFGMPEEAPDLSPALYRDRLARLRAKATERGPGTAPTSCGNDVPSSIAWAS